MKTLLTPWWHAVSCMAMMLLALDGVCADASTEDGRALAQQVYDRPHGKDASSVVTMILKGKSGPIRERELLLFMRDEGGGERAVLMRFTLPTDVEGTGLLTSDHPGDASEQWLYLPALDRVRRISSTRKGGRFVGSDFFYEDLRDREPAMDRHELGGTDKVGGLECTQLVSTPVDPANSVYTKRVACIHRQTLVPLRVDFFQKGRDQPVKRLMARKLKKIQGYWTVLEATMYDLRAGSETLLATQRIRYDQGLPEELFSERALSDASRERQYVPGAE